MVGFRGLHQVQVDVKGRFVLPARYREALGQELVMTIDPDESCLLLYPWKEWECIEEKLKMLPSFNPLARKVQRLLMGYATEMEMDAQGRLLLPAVLRTHARLEKSLILLGQGHRFEIWNPEQWEAQSQNWIAEGVMRQQESVDLGGLSL